jgi:antitoxin YefM
MLTVRMWRRCSTHALILDLQGTYKRTESSKATFMAHVSFTDLRQNMASYFDRVTDDREPLLVTRQGGKGNVVILAEEEFAGWQETVHLLSSPKNAARLLASIHQMDSGQGQPHELFEEAGPDAG